MVVVSAPSPAQSANSASWMAPIVGPEHPIRATLHDRVAEVLEALDGARGRARAERRTEALVGALVQVEAGPELGIEGRRRLGDGAAVIGERGVDRQPPRRRFDDEAIEPFGRNKVEQRRCRDQIERTVERKLEIAGEIDRPGDDGQVRRPGAVAACASRLRLLSTSHQL